MIESPVEKIKQEIIDVEKIIEEEKKDEEECIANLETMCNPLISQAYKRGFRDAKKDVLKILAVHEEKLQELADLLKNRPKLDEIYPINKAKYEAIYQFLMKREKCFEKFEKKFAELGVESQKRRQ